MEPAVLGGIKDNQVRRGKYCVFNPACPPVFTSYFHPWESFTLQIMQGVGKDIKEPDVDSGSENQVHKPVYGTSVVRLQSIPHPLSGIKYKPAQKQRMTF